MRSTYAAKAQRDLRNENDGIYREGGSVLMLAVSQASSGYAAGFDVDLDLSNHPYITLLEKT